MKENDEEEKLIDNSQGANTIEKDQKNAVQNQLKDNVENGARRMTSFEIELMNAVKKEEEEQQRIKILKEKKKIVKKLDMFNKKDYLFFFILLMSSSLNFSYLYLMNIIIALIYIFFLEKLSQKAKKIKYLCEVFSIGYSSYLLIFKLISLILINNKNESYITHKNLFIDLGICHLKKYAEDDISE